MLRKPKAQRGPQPLAMAGVKCVLNAGKGEEVKGFIAVEYKTPFCYTKEFWTPCLHSGELTDVFKEIRHVIIFKIITLAEMRLDGSGEVEVSGG